MARIGRIVSVTLGLIGAGFIFGALAGGTALTTVILMEGDRLSGGFGIGAIYGAPLGAIIAPLLSWLLLRRVPLGLMFSVCSIGTMAGGVAGWVTTSQFGNPIERALFGAFTGCCIAAIALWMRVQRVPTSVR